MNLTCFTVSVIGLSVTSVKQLENMYVIKMFFKHNKSVYNFTQLSTHMLYFDSME